MVIEQSEGSMGSSSLIELLAMFLDKCNSDDIDIINKYHILIDTELKELVKLS
jgi:hypothetical protein